MERARLVSLMLDSPQVWIGAGLGLMGLLFALLGFWYEDPRYEESGVVQDLRTNAWMMANSGGVSGYVEIWAADTGSRRRWTLPLRTAMRYKDRLSALQGRYVKVVVAGDQAKEILQLVRDGETVIPLEESLKYRAQGRAWFGWGGLVMLGAGALLWVWQCLAVSKRILSVKTEPT